MKLNRKLVLILSLVLSLALATGGTLAYLTDRDSAANVFTIGNVEIDLTEDFEQGAELIPGVDIEKKPTITNTGKNDAWVWATVAIPSALDNDDASKNIVHFNYDKDGVGEGLWTWTDENKNWLVEKDVKIDDSDVTYNVYTVLYQTALKPEETTEYPVMTKVYMDTAVDIAPDGTLYKVVKGEATEIDWNINEDGNPVIFVSAYAIQKEGFETVQDAYAAYNAQWGKNGTEYADPDDVVIGEVVLPTTEWDTQADTSWYDAAATEYTLSTAEELAGFAKLVNEEKVTFSGKTVKLGADVDLGDHLWIPVGQTGATEFKGVFDGNGKTISNLYIDSSDEVGGHYSSGLFGWLENHGSGITVRNVTVDGAVVKGHHNVGVIVGYVYGTIENCTVKNAELECTHANDDACGDKAGVIAGYAGDGYFTNNQAIDCTVTAGRDAGQLFGCIIASQEKNFKDNTATNVVVSATGDCTGNNVRNEIIGRK